MYYTFERFDAGFGRSHREQALFLSCVRSLAKELGYDYDGAVRVNVTMPEQDYNAFILLLAEKFKTALSAQTSSDEPQNQKKQHEY